MFSRMGYRLKDSESAYVKKVRIFLEQAPGGKKIASGLEKHTFACPTGFFSPEYYIAPESQKEKVVYHHAVMSSITHLVTYVVLPVYYSLFESRVFN